MIHFGIDGWRGRIDEDFTDDNVARVADAAGRVWERRQPGATVYIGFDTRPAARGFAIRAAEVLAAHDLRVKLCRRYLPTPALSWAVVEDASACGAVMITASHNPGDHLGIKFRMADGGTATDDFIEELEREIESKVPERTGAFETADPVDAYLAALASHVDAEAIRAARLRVVCDPLYGASRSYFTHMLEDMGVEVQEIHGDDDEEMDEFHADPVEPWVDECERVCAASGAMAGLVIDGDADRVGAVDERGRYVNSQKIISLVLGHLVLNRHESGRVVLNLSCSTLVRRVAKALDCRVTIKPIGFKYIYKEMCKGDVILGGEEAGGIGVPMHLPERDGLLVNLLLCELMAMTGKTLAQLVDELEEHFGVLCFARRDVRLESEVTEMLRTILPGVNPQAIAGKKPVTVSHMDGLRLEFEDESWLLLRPSGTESVVRVYAEAGTVEERDALLDAGCDLARGGGVD